jgi:hypothetical protein
MPGGGKKGGFKDSVAFWPVRSFFFGLDGLLNDNCYGVGGLRSTDESFGSGKGDACLEGLKLLNRNWLYQIVHIFFKNL